MKYSLELRAEHFVFCFDKKLVGRVTYPTFFRLKNTTKTFQTIIKSPTLPSFNFTPELKSRAIPTKSDNIKHV